MLVPEGFPPTIHLVIELRRCRQRSSSVFSDRGWDGDCLGDSLVGHGGALRELVRPLDVLAHVEVVRPRMVSRDEDNTDDCPVLCRLSPTTKIVSSPSKYNINYTYGHVGKKIYGTKNTTPRTTKHGPIRIRAFYRVFVVV